MTEKAQEKLKAKVLAELAVNPIVEQACKRAGLSRATYYRWLEDEDFGEATELAIAQGRDRVNDMAESQILKGIGDNEFRYVKYWLDHNHRRYIVKVPARRPFKRITSFFKLDDGEW